MWMRRVLLIGFAALAFAAPAAALRIVSLAPSVTETLFALGVGDQVVGVSAYCDYPPEVTKLPRVGTFLTPSIETIIALHPDLVIGVPSPGNETPVKTLQSVGLHVVIVWAETVEDTRQSVRAIAAAVGQVPAGEALLSRMDGRIAGLRRQLDDAPPRTVLIVVGQKPLIGVGGGTFQDELIRMARGINVAANAGLAWPHLSLERVIAWAPEVVIDTSMGSEEGPHILEFWNQFPSLPAVRDHRVYGFGSAELLRPGPRMPQALEAIARAIHPEKFGSAASQSTVESRER